MMQRRNSIGSLFCGLVLLALCSTQACAFQVGQARRIQVGPNGILFRNNNQAYVDVEPIPGVSIAAEGGPLEAIEPVLSDHLKPKSEDGNLVMQLPEDYQTAASIQQQISQLVRNYGSSSSSSGNGYFVSMAGNSLNGYFTSMGQTSFMLQENTETRRTLYGIKRDDSSQIMLTNQDGYLLALTYGPQQKVHVVECDGDLFFNKRYDDFSQLQLADSEYYETRLRPILARFGLHAPTSGYSTRSRTLVGECLKLPQQQVEKFQSAFGDQLQATDYQSRRQAMETLTKEYNDHAAVIHFLMLDDSQPAELRNQLQLVVKEKDPELNELMDNALIPGDMLKNASFLTWMLKSELEAGEPDQELVALLRQRMATLTGDPADTDIQQWVEQQFGAIKAENYVNNVSPPSLPKFAGEDVKLNRPLSELIPLALEEGRIKLERDRWKRPFGDLTIQEHLAQIQQQMEEHHLPSGWLRPTVPNLDQDVYAMLLFQQLQVESKRPEAQQMHMIQMRQNARRNYNQNNAIFSSFNEHHLELDLGKPPIQLHKSPFRFGWSVIGGNELMIVEEPGQSFRFTMQGYEEGQRLMVHSTADHFHLLAFSDQHVTNVRTKDYPEFCQRYPDLKKLLVESVGTTLQLELPAVPEP